MPSWLSELIACCRAGSTQVFVIWGNIYDLLVGNRDETATDSDGCQSIYELLAQMFGQRQLIMFYSLSSGLQFANETMEKFFRQTFLHQPTDASGAKPSASEQAKQSLGKTMSEQAPLAKLVGDTPEQVLKFLDKVLSDEASGSKVLVLDYAQNLLADNSHASLTDRLIKEIIDRWSRSNQLAAANSLVVLLTQNLASLPEDWRSSQSRLKAVRIPKPDADERAKRWAYNFKSNGVKLADDLNVDKLGLITNGLSLYQIDDIYRLAKTSGQEINLTSIKRAKQEILNNEFGERLKVKVPDWGFDYFGGKTKLKQYLLEVRDNILRGLTRRVPMGLLAAGPPGTGKTFFFECFAYECGFNFVEIKNPRSMWVGQSEEIMAKILAALDDLAPVIVVEDEADQSETSRDAPNGDSGVANRLRQMKFEFCSEPKRRGKVIWIRISNRDDLLDAAYKRKGRTDDNIPFILPQADEYQEIIEVMFARYQIPYQLADIATAVKAIQEKIYCTGADVEWMVLEADKYAGREGVAAVTDQHLRQAIADWEMPLDAREIDRQIALAIKGSSKSLRPDNWQAILEQVDSRSDETIYSAAPAVHPGLARQAVHS